MNLDFQFSLCNYDLLRCREQVETKDAVIQLKAFEENCVFISWSQIATRLGSQISYSSGGLSCVQSSICRTLANQLAYATLDKFFQRKRREQLTRRSITPYSLCRNLGKDVIESVTGLVMRPIEGAQQQGAIGLVKGLGKGAIGIIPRVGAAFLDFTSGLMDFAKK